jgi:hypothetical protein
MLFIQSTISRKLHTSNDSILPKLVHKFKTEMDPLSLSINTLEHSVLNFVIKDKSQINCHSHPTLISIEKNDQANAMLTDLGSLRIPATIHGKAFVPSMG